MNDIFKARRQNRAIKSGNLKADLNLILDVEQRVFNPFLRLTNDIHSVFGGTWNKNSEIKNGSSFVEYRYDQEAKNINNKGSSVRINISYELPINLRIFGKVPVRIVGDILINGESSSIDHSFFLKWNTFSGISIASKDESVINEFIKDCRSVMGRLLAV